MPRLKPKTRLPKPNFSEADLISKLQRIPLTMNMLDNYRKLVVAAQRMGCTPEEATILANRVAKTNYA